MITIEPDELSRAESEVESLLESCLAKDGWKTLLHYRVVRTSDFREFQLIPWAWNAKPPADSFEFWLATRPDPGKPLRWARALRRRGAVPDLATIPHDELLDTLTLADNESDYDPIGEIARVCVADLVNQAKRAGALRIVPKPLFPAEPEREDRTGTIVSTVLITLFIVFVLSMCSHHYSQGELEQMDQQQDAAYR